MSKPTTIILSALAALTFSTGAWADESDLPETEEVDWEEALEFAELVDWHVENGETWVTYHDELQGVMWSQPASTTDRQVLEFFLAEPDERGTLDFCIYQWLVPYYV